jgi:DNA repair exonuclease SbcCD nuclease subunit
MERVTIPEAADILGVTRDAVRKRIKRDTIRYEIDNSGETYVYVDASATDKDASATVGDTSGQDDRDVLIEFLRSELAMWQEEARRKDHLLAAALERIPAIEEASTEPRESPETSSDLKPGLDPQGDDAGPETGVSRPWWRRIFSG